MEFNKTYGLLLEDIQISDGETCHFFMEAFGEDFDKLDRKECAKKFLNKINQFKKRGNKIEINDGLIDWISQRLEDSFFYKDYNSVIATINYKSLNINGSSITKCHPSQFKIFY